MRLPDRSYLITNINNDITGRISGNFIKIQGISINVYFGVRLPFKIIKCKDCVYLFVGDFYDPDEPELDNDHVIDKIHSGSVDFLKILKNTYTMFGKWIIICDCGDSVKIMGDPHCTKSIKYCNKELLISDLASLIAHLSEDISAFNLPSGNDHRDYVLNLFKNNQWWPGDATLYDNLFSLLPNHILEYNNKSHELYINRFIDSRFMKNHSDSYLDYCYTRSQELLVGFLKSISARSNFALTVTGGRDSRVLFAACDANSINSHYFISIHGNKTIESREAHVAKELVEKCGQKLNIYNSNINNEVVHKVEYYFKEIPSRKYAEYDYITHLNGLKIDKIIVGWIPETISGYYYGRIYIISPTGLMDLARCSGNKFALKSFSKWLSALKGEKLPDGYSILDLFYWEHRSGRWASQTINVCDLFEDLICGFNCRQFYDMWLKTPIKCRSYPQRKNLNELVRRFGNIYSSIEYFTPDSVSKKIEYFLTKYRIQKPFRQFEYLLCRAKNMLKKF